MKCVRYHETRLVRLQGKGTDIIYNFHEPFISQLYQLNESILKSQGLTCFPRNIFRSMKFVWHHESLLVDSNKELILFTISMINLSVAS